MPLTDEEGLAIPEGAALEAAFWKGRARFRPIVRKMARETWRVADPVPALRLLQGVTRPLWTMEHRAETPDHRLMRDGMIPVLGAANAPLLLHSPHEAEPALPAGAHRAALSWHSNGKATGRWHYKAAALPQMLSFDRLGYSGWSELAAVERRDVLAVEAAAADAFHAGRLRPLLAQGLSKYRQDATEPVEGEGFVFVPLQLVNDSVIALKAFPEPYLEGMRRIVASLAGAGVPVVVKRHPHCDDPRVARWLADLPAGSVSVSRASVHALIPRARAVLTLNSGVGFEALLHGRPVIAAGRAEYHAAATELTDPDAAPAALAAAEAGHDPGFVRRFLFLALHQYQIDVRDPVAFQRAALRVLCQDYLERAPR